MNLRNIVDVLQQHATERPGRVVFDFVHDPRSEPHSVTFQQLHDRASAIAAVLQRQVRAGDRAILLHGTGLGFVEAFFGCLYAGVVAVPVCIPRRHRAAPNFERLLANAEPAAVLSTQALAADRASLFGKIPPLLNPIWLATDSLPPVRPSEWKPPKLGSSTLAMLQYTSGTTGTAKGVMVTHGNLMHNAQTLRQALDTRVYHHGVLWLPMHHDMGLIGGMLQTVFEGGCTTWMPPHDFARRPLRWLELISQTGASISSAPDFAFNYCVDRSTPEKRAGLDLSRWEVALVGAETVRSSTLDRFSEAFAPQGFRRSAFVPCYGLAEATLMVSAERIGSGPSVVQHHSPLPNHNRHDSNDAGQQCAHLLTSSGFVAGEQEALVIDRASGQRCGDRQIGEIWVTGPNVAGGYYNDAEATSLAFRARLAGDDRHFLRTGDLGFFDNGRLFISGRSKEMIIIRGRNLFPQDIEYTIRQSDSKFAATMTAAFAVEMFGRERLVVIQEVERGKPQLDFNKLAHEIRAAVTREFDIEVFDLLFVKHARIPRTTSGKVQRTKCREDYLAGRIEAVSRWTDRGHNIVVQSPDAPPRSDCKPKPRSVAEIEQWLLQRISRRLDVDQRRLDVGRPFSEMGLGSLDAVMICSEFEEWLQVRLSPTMIYNYPTISALAQHLSASEEDPVISPLHRATEGHDTLLDEVRQLSQRELEDFIAQELAKAANQKRAA